MTKSVTLWVVVALIIGGSIGYMYGVKKASMVVAPTNSSTSAKSVLLHSAMRKLWEDHVTWTRLYIVEATEGLKGTNDTAARLLKNQEDIGNAIKPFYGEAAGNQLTTILKQHVMGAVDVLAAAKAGDAAKLDTAKTNWYKNGDDIATFLSGANPNSWSLQNMKEGMAMHLDLTLTEAVDELKDQYGKSVEDYDKVHEHILGLADLLSDGIVAQFPDKF
ncbi:MAG TPA: hypothetical protein VLK22_04285 [Candidatus Udaeobacter sp.]|nr:hypothetical protein [Candidatus Udaeobacter sp.]